MPLPGGAADKLGNRYETHWTVRQLLRVLVGEATEIRIEPPGVDKMEFVLTVNDTREFHQAKRRHSQGAWTLARLREEGLLEAVFQRLADGADTFVFVSSSDAAALRDLAEAACDAASQEEFEREFLEAESRGTPFEQLLEIWRCDAPTARDLLKRIKVRTIDEWTLREEIRWRAQLFLTGGTTKSASDALRSIVGDSVHETINRDSLIRCLAKRDLGLRASMDPATATQLIHAATDRYLQDARRKLILGEVRVRKPTGDIVERLVRSDAPHQCAITGKAGIGKTACVVGIIDRLRESEMPVLAFRMDRLSDVATMSQLASYLAFGTDSPALTLQAAARGADRPAVLIIDQLDAVSTASGRTADAFDLVEHLLEDVRSLSSTPPVHAVIVCRDFDFTHDSGLRSLMAQSATKVTVKQFSPDELGSILAEAGCDPGALQQRQLDLLRVPQNLALFLDISPDSASPPGFATVKELFDQYWKVKRGAVRRRPDVQSDEWMAVMEILCERMTETQRLAVAAEHLDDVEPAYLAGLVSEGVLVRDRGTLSFAHESLLDYVFARLFVQRDITLAAFLKNAGQDLFRRAQVRQTLTYLRDTDRERYVGQLRELLGDPEIRPHIKDLVLSWLAEVPDPLDGEWEAWEEHVAPVLAAYQRGDQCADDFARLAWRRLLPSTEWLAYLDRRDLVDDWLSWRQPTLVNELTVAMNRDQNRFGQRLGTLLGEKQEEGGERPIHIQGRIAMAGRDMSRETFEGILRYVDAATLDELGGGRGVPGMLQTFWYLAGESRPEWMVELIAAALRCAARTIQSGGVALVGPNLLGGGLREGQEVEAAAEAAPDRFAELVLPPVLELSELTAYDRPPPRRDRIWWYVARGERLTVRDAVVSALADAVSIWASKGSVPEAILDDLRQRDTRVSNHMLLAVYKGGARHYGKDAIELLIEEPWRFECGPNDSPRWFAQETVGPLAECCSEAELGRLAEAIMSYVPAWERTPQGRRSRGLAEFDLLSAIPAGLRSQRVLRRLGELERKFTAPSEEPKGVRGGFLGSPIAPRAADKMTDEHWLSAIEKYGERGSRFAKGDELIGGALELSRELERRTKEDPNRFGGLASRLPEDANPVYLSGILRGLDGTEHAVADDVKLAVCAKAFADAPEDLNVGSAIADVLRNLEDPSSDEAVEILSWLATQHPHPDSATVSDEAERPSSDGVRGIYTAGINTTRGRAAEAVAKLIVRDADNIDRFEEAIDAMLIEQHVAVVACVGRAIAAVGAHDAPRGIQLVSRVECADAVVLATPHFQGFLASQLPERFEEVRGLVEQMIRSGSPDAQKAGAQLAGLAVLYGHDSDGLVAAAMKGSVDHRQGIAEVASRNVAVSACRGWCEAHLTVLFDDEDEAVRQRAATCFQQIEDRGFEGYEGLIGEFVESRAFLRSAHEILYALKRARSRLPGVTCLVCERCLDHFGESAGDISTRASGLAMDVAKLVFRTYQQHQGDAWGDKALDLIDRLCLAQAFGVREEFEEFER